MRPSGTSCPGALVHAAPRHRVRAAAKPDLSVLNCISQHLVGRSQSFPQSFGTGRSQSSPQSFGTAGLRDVCSSAETESFQTVKETTGPLVAIGGGGMDKGGEILTAIKGLVAEHSQAWSGFRVLILPQASARHNAGQAGVTMWEAAGAARVVNLVDTPIDREVALTELAVTDVLWFPGGSQTRLANALAEADLMGVIRQRSREGMIIAGTSAGAAIQSDVMLSGSSESSPYISGARASDDIPDPRPGWRKGLTHSGLALWGPVILDQHFSQRGRQSRLLSTILDNPDLLGVGLDERTAVVVQGSTFHVVGEGTVSVYDARNTVNNARVFDVGERQTVREAKLSLLRSGQEFVLQEESGLEQQQEQEDPSTDLRSYRLGAIGAFAECVGAGVKTLGLSSAMLEPDLSALLDDACEIIARNGAKWFVETDFLVTDLFASSVTDGMHVLLIYRDDSTLAKYKELKAQKVELVRQGQWNGDQREAVARSMAKLLSYPDEKTEKLLVSSA